LGLIATHPLETFFVKLKIALFGGIVLGFPVVAYQLYRFVAPGLYKNERGAFLPYLIMSPVLFILGASLVFFYVFPYVMEFALHQQTLTDGDQVDLLTKISDYLKLATTLFLAFGLSFQLPVILSLLGRAGIVSAAALKKARKLLRKSCSALLFTCYMKFLFCLFHSLKRKLREAQRFKYP